MSGLSTAPWGCSSLPPLTPRQLGDCVLFLSYLILKVYQIYAKRSPEEVHSLLRSFGTDFVILEDSICYERRHQRGCRLRDLLDVANGHVSTLLLHLMDPSERAEIQDASQVVPFTLDHMCERHHEQTFVDLLFSDSRGWAGDGEGPEHLSAFGCLA